VSGQESDPVVELLRGVPFFKSLDRVDLARLLGALEEVPDPGDIMAHEGTEADALYLLERGTVAITVASPEGDLSLHVAETGLRSASPSPPNSRTRSTDARASTSGRPSRTGDRKSEHAISGRRAGGGRAPLARSPQSAFRRFSGTSRLPPASTQRDGASCYCSRRRDRVARRAGPRRRRGPGARRGQGGTGLVTLPVAFSGFASSSWLLALGALALAAAMARTGLLFRMALLLLRTFPASATGQLLALLIAIAASVPAWKLMGLLH
jgi:hypothetical protein